MNPSSNFAKSSHAVIALAQAFRQGASAGRARHAELKAAYGGGILSEMLLNQTGYTLLRRRENAPAIEMFKLNAEEHPRSSNAHDSLGEAYAANGDVQLAIRSYERALELDPANANAAARLRSLRQIR
jgi:Flp pilus assembly protein TadD